MSRPVCARARQGQVAAARSKAVRADRSGVAVLALCALAASAAGCASPPGDGGAQPPAARLADFTSCPWNGTAGVPDGCDDEVARLQAGAPPPVAGPCVAEVLPGGDVTLRVHRQPEGVAIESAVGGGRDWHAVAWFSGDPTRGYAWETGAAVSWFLLPEAPTSGQLHVLFLAYDLETVPAMLGQGAQVRWAVEPSGLRPLLATPFQGGSYFDVGLYATPPPFVLVPTNLDLDGEDFSLRLHGVENNRAKLQFQDPPLNGLACAVP